jgi:hypothetical protein
MASDVEELTRLHEAADPRTIAEMKAEDVYEEGVLAEAKLSEDGRTWSFAWDGRGCMCAAREGVEAKEGDLLRIYTDGGSEFHGIDVNGVEMFYRTPWERFAHRIGWLARHDRDQRERFAAEASELDAKYAGLSAPMKARIDRFRAAEPDFRVKGEAYEMFACQQADAFAARARQAAADGEDRQPEVVEWFSDGSFAREHPAQAERPAKDPTGAVRWLLWWSKLPYDRQRELMPAMDEGHSGNTFGAAWFYAVRLLLGEDV